jgi:ABC-type Zn2+ transport system substrate-binding protein/surface adhesin
MDIVGFEHDATTDDQKVAMEKAKAQLAQPLAVFKLPAAAGCTVADAKVELQAEHHHDGDADDDHDNDHDKTAGADHDHAEHEGHKEFHVTYALDCAKPASITAIDFDYFKMFAGAHDLTVNVVTAKAQNTYEVSRDAPSLDLAGIM